MGPCSSSRCGKSVRFTVKLVVGMLLGLWAAALCYAQDIPIGATYVCGGEDQVRGYCLWQPDAPDCQKSVDAIKADAASSVRADGNGGGTFPAVAPGSYHLMISTRYNNQPLVWDQAVQLKAGQNSLTLDQRNAAPIQ